MDTAPTPADLRSARFVTVAGRERQIRDVTTAGVTVPGFAGLDEHISRARIEAWR